MSGIIMLERQDQHRCKTDGGVIGTSVDNPSEFAVAPFFGPDPPSSGLYEGMLWIDSSSRASSRVAGTPPYELRRWSVGRVVWELVGYVPFTGLGASHSTGLVPDPGTGSGGALATDYLARDSSWQPIPVIPTDTDTGTVIGPGVRLNIGPVQHISTSTETLVSFDTGNYVTPGTMYSAFWNGAHPERLTAPIDGEYAICAHLTWGLPVAANKQCRATILYHGASTNDSTIRTVAIAQEQKQFATAVVYTSTNVSTQWMLAAGEYVEVSVWQNTGSTLDIVSDVGVGGSFYGSSNGADPMYGACFSSFMMSRIAEYSKPHIEEGSLPE